MFTNVEFQKIARGLVSFRVALRKEMDSLSVFTAGRGDPRLEALDVLVDAHEDIGRMMSLLGKVADQPNEGLLLIPPGISDKIRCLGFRAAQALPEIRPFVERNFA